MTAVVRALRRGLLISDIEQTFFWNSKQKPALDRLGQVSRKEFGHPVFYGSVERAARFKESSGKRRGGKGARRLGVRRAPDLGGLELIAAAVCRNFHLTR